MGAGQRLGELLQSWLETETAGLSEPRMLANRWIDALGSDESLKAPLRDLASRPLFQQALRQGANARRTSLEQLVEQLRATYSPAVMAELLDLLDALSGNPLPRPDTGTVLPQPEARLRRSTALGALEPIAPGLALAAGAALVTLWLGQELERLLLRSWAWPSGAVLVVLLALIEALRLSPLGRSWRGAALTTTSASDGQQAWRWVSAPWLHAHRGEAILNLVLLAVLIGPTPLPLGQLLLRYLLSSLAALTPAVLVASRSGQDWRWGGAAGAVGCLIGLGAGLSLLQGRSLHYTVGPLTIPAWVLLLLVSSLQLIWSGSRGGRRATLLCSSWFWGLLLGGGWALVTWVQQLVERHAA